MRNNQDDFKRWYKHIVHHALFNLEQFAKGRSCLLFEDEYFEAINVRRQLLSIKSLLDDEHNQYLEEFLLKGKREEGIMVSSLYKDVFQVWQSVCFPGGKSRIKTINPVLLGGEFRFRRLERTIPAKHAAELVGIAEPTLYCYEEGTRMMRVDTFYKLCQIYKTKPEEIIKKAAI